MISSAMPLLSRLALLPGRIISDSTTTIRWRSTPTLVWWFSLVAPRDAIQNKSIQLPKLRQGRAKKGLKVSTWCAIRPAVEAWERITVLVHRVRVPRMWEWDAGELDAIGVAGFLGEVPLSFFKQPLHTT